MVMTTCARPARSCASWPAVSTPTPNDAAEPDLCSIARRVPAAVVDDGDGDDDAIALLVVVVVVVVVVSYDDDNVVVDVVDVVVAASNATAKVVVVEVGIDGDIGNAFVLC